MRVPPRHWRILGVGRDGRVGEAALGSSRHAVGMSTPRTRAAVLVVLSLPSLLLVGGCTNDATDSGSVSTTTVPRKLEGVVADANRMAPALESELRGTTYPTTLSGARQALENAGIEPTGRNVVGGYEYDAEAVEFTLCIESPDGAYATYDTAPMALFVTGESGGCPKG